MPKAKTRAASKKKPARKKPVSKKAASKKAASKKSGRAKAGARRLATKKRATAKKPSLLGLVFGAIEQVEHFSASPAIVYEALMDGKLHAAFTGAAAKVAAKKGGAFEAWDGYIRGKNLELVPGEKIVQSWRASDFPPEYPDSTLEIDLTPESGGTKLRLRHTQLPEKRVEFYHSGWHDHYWQPLRAWLTTQDARPAGALMHDADPPTLRMPRK